VSEVAEAMGYRPNAAAKALVTGRTHTVLLAWVGQWDSNMIDRLRGIEAYLIPLGYSTRICTADTSAAFQAFTEMLRSHQADGVLLAGHAGSSAYPLVRAIQKEADSMGVPVVALIDAFPRELVDGIADIDDKGGAKQAVEHLIGHGHRRIAFLGVTDRGWSQERYLGYMEALHKAGIPVDLHLVFMGEWSQKTVYENLLRSLNSVDFSAIFVVDDYLAVAVLSALAAAGKRVPEDCAIIGFDNDETLAEFSNPPLTTVQNPLYEVGNLAAKMLVNRIEGRSIEPVVLPVQLVIRRSCGCPYRDFP